jgi:hypothetical protein
VPLSLEKGENSIENIVSDINLCILSLSLEKGENSIESSNLLYINYTKLSICSNLWIIHHISNCWWLCILSFKFWSEKIFKTSSSSPYI